jgi:Xaa-Pro aminopeptidase
VRLLNPDERKWLNDYHKTVAKKLTPYLDRHERTWLKGACAAV